MHVLWMCKSSHIYIHVLPLHVYVLSVTRLRFMCEIEFIISSGCNHTVKTYLFVCVDILVFTPLYTNIHISVHIYMHPYKNSNSLPLSGLFALWMRWFWRKLERHCLHWYWVRSGCTRCVCGGVAPRMWYMKTDTAYGKPNERKTLSSCQVMCNVYCLMWFCVSSKQSGFTRTNICIYTHTRLLNMYSFIHLQNWEP